MTPTAPRRARGSFGRIVRLCQRPGCDDEATIVFGAGDMRVTRGTISVCAIHQRWGRAAFVRIVNAKREGVRA